MDIFDGLFGNSSVGYSLGVPGDARAVSKEELAQIAAAQMYMQANVKPDPLWYLRLQNYRPPAHVPKGWADWVEIGDDLH